MARFRFRRQVINEICSGVLTLIALTIAQFAQAADGPLEFPRTPPTKPADAGKSFETLDGFRMQLIAAEPLVTSPVALEYDEHGQRLGARNAGLSVHRQEHRQALCRKNRPTSRWDEFACCATPMATAFSTTAGFSPTIFRGPTGLAFWKGGCSSRPLPTSGTSKTPTAMARPTSAKKLFTGFRKFNIQTVINNLKWGLDHQVYGAGGTNGGRITSLKDPQAAAMPFGANDFRIDPATTKLEASSRGAPDSE